MPIEASEKHTIGTRSATCFAIDPTLMNWAASLSNELEQFKMVIVSSVAVIPMYLECYRTPLKMFIGETFQCHYSNVSFYGEFVSIEP